MPLPFILAALGSLASGAAAAGTAVAGAAAAAGAAVAGTAAAIGAITVLGVSVSTILTWAGGLWLLAEWTDFNEEEGIKIGYKRASREYEAKLNRQAELFLKELENAKNQIKEHKMARANAEKFARDMSNLCGEYEGLLRKYADEGKSPLDDTVNYYHTFQELKKQAKAA